MFGSRPLIASTHGMVAAAHPQAAIVGANVLRDGGNAFDAAVAVAAALNVVEPFMSGLAGLGMASVYVAAERRVRCLDFLPGVPLDFDPAQANQQQIFRGPLASAPPGSLAGWATLNEAYGRKPFADLLAPAIRLARDGFVLTDGVPAMHRDWFDLRSEDPEWLRVYTPGTADVAVGQVLRQPDLARTLEAVAAHGIAHLYGGPLGAVMVRHLRDAGGVLSMADLEQVAPRWLAPIAVDFRGLRVHTLPPPAEAFQVLLSLALLANMDLDGGAPHDLEHLDTVLRALRLAGECRVANNRPAADGLARLLAPAQLDEMLDRLRGGEVLRGRMQRWQAVTDPRLAAAREHTTSFSTADREGNMVCITQSLGSVYGSGVVIPDTGVTMNNFLNWGDLDPGSPNRLVPGAALAMCLAPTISTRDGEAVLALGTPGSYGILQTTVQVMVNHIALGLDLQSAIEAPRARLFDGDFGVIESRIPSAVVDGLRQRGHQLESVEPWTLKVGGFQAVSRDPQTGVLTGAADPRRDGYAVSP